MRGRRSISILLIAAYFIASNPLLPSAAMLATWCGVRLRERFPCEACNCGCGNAQHCWTACCCYTPQQRLEWARRHGVAPPPYAQIPAPANGPANTPAAPLACCAHDEAVTPSAPLQSSEPAHDVESRTGDSNKSPLQCQGHSALAFAAPTFRCAAAPVLMILPLLGMLAVPAPPSQRAGPPMDVPTPPPQF